MSDPFRANQQALGERAALLERENAAFRAEVARIVASVEPPSTRPPRTRLRAPFVALAVALAVQLVWYARTFYVIHEANSRPVIDCEL